MEWLNYHHLVYFWTVAHEGGLLPAARKLRVTHSTVGAQVHALEEALGAPLLERSGRRLVPTETGRVVLRYADEIVGLGRELLDTVKGHPAGRPRELAVGIVGALPKLVSRKMLAPAQRLDEAVRLVCVEDRLDRLLGALASHELDVVLSDAPPAPGASVRVYSHVLGTSEVSWFGVAALARALAPGFPRSLDGAPMILPGEGTTLRRSLDGWLATQRIRPRVVAEIEDSALLKAFGQDGNGVFPAPRVVAAEVMRQYGVREVGIARGVLERFHAITAERRFVHPAVAAITEAARSELFAGGKSGKKGGNRKARPVS